MKKSEFDKLMEGASPGVRKAALALVDAVHLPLEPDRKPSIRLPRRTKMSKPEQEYKAALQVEFPDCRVDFEKWSLRLESGARYTPDFTVWRANELVICVEVKGGFRLKSAARSYLAFKTAITEWPNLRFRFAEKREDGTWATVENEL